MNNQRKTGVKIIIGIAVSLSCFAACTLFKHRNNTTQANFFNALGGNDKIYNTNELVTAYNRKSREIDQVIRYFRQITPRNKYVEIEFKNDDELDRLSIAPNDTTQGADQAVEFQDWNLPVTSHKADSVIATLGWKASTLSMLKEKLDQADCISIANTYPVILGFKRSGLGLYSFDVYDANDTAGAGKKLNDSCTHIYINNRLVLEYGGGAVGPQCFPKR